MINIRKPIPTDLVKAYKCGCGTIIPRRMQIEHKISCKHPQANTGQDINIISPELYWIQTNGGPLILEGVEGAPAASEDVVKMFPRTVEIDEERQERKDTHGIQ